MAELGYATTGANQAPMDAGFVILSGPYTASEAGTINSIKMHMDGGGPAGADQVWRGVVYRGASVATAALLARGAEVTVPNAASAATFVSAAASEAFSAGDVLWIGMEAGATNDAAHWYGDSGQTAYYVANTYPTAPDPFGSTSSFDTKLTAWIDYTADVGAPTYSGTPGPSGFELCSSGLTGQYIPTGFFTSQGADDAAVMVAAIFD
jgi:hypothetical protein